MTYDMKICVMWMFTFAIGCINICLDLSFYIFKTKPFSHSLLFSFLQSLRPSSLISAPSKTEAKIKIKVQVLFFERCKNNFRAVEKWDRKGQEASTHRECKHMDRPWERMQSHLSFSTLGVKGEEVGCS